MRKTKIFLTTLMAILLIYFAYTFVFVPLINIEGAPSLFDICLSMFNGKSFGSITTVENGQKILLYSPLQIYIIVEVIVSLLILLWILFKYRKIYNNQPIQKGNIFCVLLVLAALVCNIMMLGLKFNGQIYKINPDSHSEEMWIKTSETLVLSITDPSMSMSTLLYGHITIFMILLFIQFTLCLICGKYGDFSPVEVKSKTKKTSSPKTKKEFAPEKEDKSFVKDTENKVFYTGPVPKPKDKIFLGLTDEDDKGIIDNPANQNTNSKDEEIGPAIVKEQVIFFEEPKEKTNNSFQYGNEEGNHESFSFDKPKPKEDKPFVFTSNSKIDKSERIIFTNHPPVSNPDEVSSEDKTNDFSFFSSNNKTQYEETNEVKKVNFDFKKFYLDSNDEYYGESEDDEDIEVDVPDIPEKS